MINTQLLTLLLLAASTLIMGLLFYIYTQQLARRRDRASFETERDALVGVKAQLESQLQRLQSDFEALQQTHQTRNQELSVCKALAAERERNQLIEKEHFEALRTQMKAEFDSLTRTYLSQRDQELRQHNEASIGAILKPLADKIDSFQSRVNQIHSDWSNSSVALSEQIKHLNLLGSTLGQEANNLSRALKGDKKLVGNWGEAQLEQTLQISGLVRGQHYDAQAGFKADSGQRQVPDFIVYLPEGKHIIIDSKVSLVDYESAIAATSDEVRDKALSRHCGAVKDHINDLANKRYDQLPAVNSPDFVLMYIPVEPAYIEVMRHQRDLFAYGYERGVVLVSHTTLMPVLRTISNLWMVEYSNREAKEVSDRAGDIYNSVCTVAERLQRLGQTLQTTSKHFNDTVTALVGRQGLHGKVETFKQLSQRATRDFNAPDEVMLTTDEQRLEQSLPADVEKTRQ